MTTREPVTNGYGLGASPDLPDISTPRWRAIVKWRREAGQ